MKKIAIALSVNRKIDELAFSIELLRKHWGRDVFLSVCCNDEPTLEKVKKLDIDRYIEGDNSIPITPKPYLRCRQFDCISKSMSSCFDNAEYVMHIHADAYVLEKNSVENIINEMSTNNKLIAFRGRGLDSYNPKVVYGDVDDHFFFLQCLEAKNRNYFLCNPIDYVTQCNVESLLANRLKTVYTIDETYHYSDMSKNIVHDNIPKVDFYEDSINHRAMNPFNFDPERKFLHAASIKDVNRFLVGKEVNKKNDYLDDWLNQ